MRAYLLLGLAVATPALAATPEARPVDEAAKVAMDVCAAHANGGTPIVGASGQELDAKGVIYQLNPPDFLASTRSSVLGIAQYAKSPSVTGEIWSLGYDSGGCMVIALGASTADVEKGLTAYFAGAKGWRSDRPSTAARPGERKLAYAWNPRRNLKLTATISLRDADNTTTVTITRSTS